MNWCPVRPLKSRAMRILLAAWIVVNFSPYASAQLAGGSSFVRGDANVVIPRAVANSLANSGVVDIAQETILANGETLEIGDITVEAVAMYNLTADRLGFHPKGRGNSYVIDLAGTRAYVSDDTEDIPEMRALGEHRRRLDLHEPPVHHDARPGRVRGARVRAEGRLPVSLPRPESRTIQGSRRGAVGGDRGPGEELVPLTGSAGTFSRYAWR